MDTDICQWRYDNESDERTITGFCNRIIPAAAPITINIAILIVLSRFNSKVGQLSAEGEKSGLQRKIEANN